MQLTPRLILLLAVAKSLPALERLQVALIAASRKNWLVLTHQAESITMEGREGSGMKGGVT